VAYYEGIIKNTEFFTTSELAKKLKMNAQVITRKVQAGEISAYKIGKDWRIPEQSVYSWLEELSNQTEGNGNGNSNGKGNGNGKSIAAKNETVQLQPIPPMSAALSAKNDLRSKRMYLLEYILAQFEPERSYAEDEVNMIIARYHNDYETIRREFVLERMMDHAGEKYRRRAGYKFTD